MKPGVIILSRMNSSRLPGKALEDICGKPLLSRVIQRLELLKSERVKIVVATSRSHDDDPIQKFCDKQQVDCFRGSLDHVSDRLFDCAAEFQFDRFARVNGDSPFTDPVILLQALNIARDDQFDFVTNLTPRSFPYGVAAEVFRNDWIQTIRQTKPQLIDPEHVTSRFYTNAGQLNQFNIAGKYADAIDCRLTIDTPNDLAWLKQFVCWHGESWSNTTLQTAIDHRRSFDAEHESKRNVA